MQHDLGNSMDLEPNTNRPQKWSSPDRDRVEINAFVQKK